MSEFSSYPRRFARINASVAGADNTVIAAVPGGRIVVLGYVINANAAGVVTFQDTAASPGIVGAFEFTDGGGVSYAGSEDAPAFALPKGEGFEVNNAGGVQSSGHVTYLVVV